MTRIAVFPGSFDPFTRGHEDIVRRALPLFDSIVIGIGFNSQKSHLFPPEKRKSWIESLFKNEPSVSVEGYEGLTADFCRKKNARWILRGLRNGSDLAYEEPIAQMNRRIGGQPETVFIAASPELSYISSTILRELHRNGSDIKPFLPEGMNIDA